MDVTRSPDPFAPEDIETESERHARLKAEHARKDAPAKATPQAPAKAKPKAVKAKPKAAKAKRSKTK